MSERGDLVAAEKTRGNENRHTLEAWFGKLRFVARGWGLLALIVIILTGAGLLVGGYI